MAGPAACVPPWALTPQARQGRAGDRRASPGVGSQAGGAPRTLRPARELLRATPLRLSVLPRALSVATVPRRASLLPLRPRYRVPPGSNTGGFVTLQHEPEGRVPKPRRLEREARSYWD